LFFAFTIGVGFIINSIGLIINISNQFLMGKKGKAFFGKTSLSGAVFFWYTVFSVLKLLLLKQPINVFDWVIIGLALALTAFGEPLERLIDGERPVVENGMLSLVIGAVVELLETVITYLSNSISFVRVGAFALAHAVLGTIIANLMEIVPVLPGKIAVGIIGNGIVVVLEGMIVAIQVLRLQYYEFFSKFFNETGKEFKPFKFVYTNHQA
ncbi:MAG: ATPase, partial [Treponema sp.]|nr:ATPase [Treponema sp.]